MIGLVWFVGDITNICKDNSDMLGFENNNEILEGNDGDALYYEYKKRYGEPRLSKEQQQAYVRKTLHRAFGDLKSAKVDGRGLQDVDDFLKQLDSDIN